MLPNWHSLFFVLAALMTCGFAVAVVISSNIVRMAFYLVMSLAGVAGLFFLAGADFLGAMQLMVYVGGTLVLLAFGVMLTARGPFVSMRTTAGQWILVALVAGSLSAVLLQTVVSVKAWNGNTTARTEAPPTTTELGMGLVGLRVDQVGGGPEGSPASSPAPSSRGISGYMLVFEIISVHLLVALVGAAYLARAKRRIAGTAKPQAALLTTDH
jgi:NADH-quinone oxidoreductase subunit J